MPRHLRLVIVPLLLVALPAAAAAAPHPQAGDPAAGGPTGEADGPRVVVDEPVLDVGKVPVGETVEAAFTLRNEGAAPLEITRVKPACGCTVAEYDEVIAPGGTGTVRAEVDTTNILGPNAKTVTVYTDDPASPRVRLTIKSNVQPFLLVQPGYARFTSLVQGEVPDDGAETSSQLVWADDFDDLRVLSVESPKSWIEVSHREAGADEREPGFEGRQWRIDVSITGDAPTGPFADHVVVTTNHPDQQELKIPVSGFIRPLIGVTPPRVELGAVDPSDENSWGVLVRNFGSAPLEIEGVDNDVPGLEVEVEPIEEGQRYKLVLRPTGEMAKGPFDGRVELRTNLAQQKTITVRLSGDVM